LKVNKHNGERKMIKRNPKAALELLIDLPESEWRELVSPASREGWFRFKCGRELFFFQQSGGFIENFI
jgi:hypothetical protein